MKFSPLVCGLLLGLSVLLAQAEAGKNLYWPGDFETNLAGGIFSRNNGIVLSETANHTPGGKKSWEAAPSQYQHIELLLPGNTKVRATFWAKAASAEKMTIKVISPPGPDAEISEKTGKAKPTATSYDVAIEGGGEWKQYTFDFETTEPYPGPDRTEVLFSMMNRSKEPVFIDDLEIKLLEERPALPPGKETGLIRNGGFEDGAQAWFVGRDPAKAPLPGSAVVAGGNNAWKALVLGSKGNPSGAPVRAAQVIAHDLARKKIRISADVALLGMADEAAAWKGVLFELADGETHEGAALAPTPKPFWLPVSLAAPSGEFKRVHATYTVPEGSKFLYLQVGVQPGFGETLAAIDNVSLEVLD